MTYVFLDVETPGLDTSLPILEIAWLLTDNNFNLLDPEPKSFVLDQDRWETVWAEIRGNEFVREMHRTSGLTEDILYGPLTPTDDVFDALVADLKTLPADESIHLAGFNVSFDRGFMEANGFRSLFMAHNFVGVHFHHRLLDLRAVELMYATAGLEIPEVQNPNKHRALADTFEAWYFARAMRDSLQSHDALRGRAE